MFKSLMSKRILAYFIDVMIVTLIANMVASLDILNPYLDKQNELIAEYNKDIINYYDENGKLYMEKLANSDFLEEYTYNTAYYGVYSSIITVTITFLYFVVFQYYNKGKTIGKAILDIVVKDKNNKNVKFSQMLIRGVIINGILTSILSIILVLKLNMSQYIIVDNVLFIINIGILISCVILAMFRKDKRLLHDLIAGTKVEFSFKDNDKNNIEENKKIQKENVRKAKIKERKRKSENSSSK